MIQSLVTWSWILALPVLIPCLFAGGGLILGTVNALYNLKVAFAAAHRAQDPQKQDDAPRSLQTRPTKMYPFGRGWSVIRYTWRNMFVYTHLTAASWIDHAATVKYVTSVRFWLLKYPAWTVIIGLHIAARVQYMPMIGLAIFFSIMYSALLGAWMATSLVCIGLLACTSFLATNIRHTTMRCPHCYRTMHSPLYLCPTCETKHPRLQPDLYGVLAHRCVTCKRRLPALDLLGRKRLPRICPQCSFPLHKDIDGGPSVYIALAGSVAAGKTTYLLTAGRELKQTYEKRYRYRISLVNVTRESSLDAQCRGKPEQAVVAEEEIVSSTYLLKIKAPGIAASREVYLYDPPGEIFSDSQHLSKQRYYTYSNGLIFLIDPWTIPAFRRRCQKRTPFEHESLLADVENMGGIMQVYERVMQAFEVHLGVRKNGRYTQPIAVVITRGDMFDLEDEIGGQAIRSLMRSDPHFTSEADARHWLVRKFLCTYDMDNLVRDIEAHFAYVRYFSCPTLDASRNPPGEASTCVAREVISPLLWLLRQTGVVK